MQLKLVCESVWEEQKEKKEMERWRPSPAPQYITRTPISLSSPILSTHPASLKANLPAPLTPARVDSEPARDLTIWGLR